MLGTFSCNLGYHSSPWQFGKLALEIEPEYTCMAPPPKSQSCRASPKHGVCLVTIWHCVHLGFCQGWPEHKFGSHLGVLAILGGSCCGGSDSPEHSSKKNNLPFDRRLFSAKNITQFREFSQAATTVVQRRLLKRSAWWGIRMRPRSQALLTPLNVSWRLMAPAGEAEEGAPLDFIFF